MADEIEVMRQLDLALSSLEDAEARSRVVRWLLSKHSISPSVAGSSSVDIHEGSDLPENLSVGTRARRWIAQHKLSVEQLEAVMHFDGDTVEVIDGPSAGSIKDRALAAYALQGAAAFLATDEPLFSDQLARDLCDRLGCYDSTNHAKTLAAFGNRLTGSKSAGWKLTAPGLSFAAECIRAVAADVR